MTEPFVWGRWPQAVLDARYAPEVIVSSAAMAANPTAAINAAIATLEASRGGRVKLPLGRYAITSTILVEGALSEDGWSGYSGIEIVGSGMRGTVLEGPSGLPLFQLGDANSKVVMAFRDMTLDGPGRTNIGSVGIDSRTTGGSYIFENLLISGFEIGIREHDNTLVDARSVNVRDCGTGWALGYFSDAHTFLSCRADECGIGYHVGYFDTTQGESVATESHGITWLGGMANLCGVGIYIAGSASTEMLTIRGTYFEQYDDVAIRVGVAGGASAITAAVDIAGYFNGNVSTNPVGYTTGKRDYAIEVNNARAVRVSGGGYRNHLKAPVFVVHSSACVEVKTGHFDKASGELGDVKLPSASYVNVGTARPVTVGPISSSAVSFASATPTASVDNEGGRLRVSGTAYESGSDGAGGYAWYAQPTARRMSELATSTPVYVPATSFKVAAGTATETFIGGGSRWQSWSLPDSALTTIIAGLSIPTGWATAHVDLLWTRTGAASGNVLWNADLYQAATGDDLTAVSGVGNTPTGAPPTANQVATLRVLSGVSVDPSKAASLRIRRNGADGADVCTDAALVLGVRITRAS